MPPDVFTQLVDAYYVPLYRFAISLVRNQADAGDLVQQTFFVWSTKGCSLRDSNKAKSWLFTTLYREFIRSRRRDSRVTPLEDLPDAGAEISARDVELLRNVDASLALGALQSLPELFRVPLSLYYVEDLSYRQIADVLEVPIGTVMSRLARGKEQLRHALDPARSAQRTETVRRSQSTTP